MARFSKLSQSLSKEDEELVTEFCDALVSLSSAKEAAQFLTDLLSNVEVKMLARRLKIAKLLLRGWKYDGISDVMKVSPATISRVGEWLKIYGEGYRLIEKRTRKPRPTASPIRDYVWRDLKKRFPITFWPEILVEDLIRNASKRQKEKVKTILRAMDKKSEVYRRIDRALRLG